MRNHARTKTEQAYRNFKRQVIALADSTSPTAPNDMAAVMPANFMVFAVWRSASELDGVGILVIKGHLYLRAIILDNQPLPPDSRVIECQGYGEACSLRAG